jgi:hypothetical protein
MMGTFLFSLSKSRTETALHIFEGLLLLSGLVLLIGIWGEYRKGEKWKKWLAVFQIMVLAGIGVELIADAGVFVFSENLQKLEGADIQALDKKARDAGDRADDALGKLKTTLERAETADITSKAAVDKSGKAEHSASNALDLAKGARQEADSFEKDIVSANEKAAAAESKVAEASKRAADASAELDRLKSPRSLTNVPELVETLRPFKGTEFMFASVFSDDESFKLLQQIEAVLDQAGWKRLKHAEINLGIPAIQISGHEDVVNTDIGTAVRIEVDSTVPVETLQSLARDKLPSNVRIAIILNEAMLSHLSPQEVFKPGNRVNVNTGSSTVIRIKVGKKP